MGKQQPPTPAEIAERVREHLRAAAAEIPGYVHPNPLQNGFVRGHRTVPVEAIQQVIYAVERSPKLQTLGKFDADEARVALELNEAFRFVVDDLKTLLSGVIFTMELEKAKAAAATLQMYTIMRGLARTPSDDDGLVTYIEQIGELLRPRGKGRKKKVVRRKRRAAPAASPDAAPGGDPETHQE